jgi:hypothetical protein
MISTRLPHKLARLTLAALHFIFRRGRIISTFAARMC